MDGCMGVFNLALPQFGGQLGLSPAEIGLAKGAATLPYALICVFAGALGDRLGWRPVAAVGCFCISVSHFFVPMANGLASLMIVCLAVSAAQGLFWPPFEGMTGVGKSGADLSKQLVPLNVSWSLGYMSGLFACGYLISTFIRLPFYVAAGAGFVAGLVVLIVRVPEQQVPSERLSKNAKATDLSRSAKTTPDSRHHRYTLAHRLANFVSYFCLAVVLTYFPARASELSLDSRAISNLVFLLGALRVAIFFVLGSWHQWHYRPGYTLGSQALGLAGMAGLVFLESQLLLFISLGCVGIMLGVTYVGSMYYSVNSDHSLGQKAGWHESMLRLGEFTGGVTGGFAASHFGDSRTPFVLGAGMVVMAVIVCGWLMKSDRAKAER